MVSFLNLFLVLLKSSPPTHIRKSSHNDRSFGRGDRTCFVPLTSTESFALITDNCHLAARIFPNVSAEESVGFPQDRTDIRVTLLQLEKITVASTLVFIFFLLFFSFILIHIFFFFFYLYLFDFLFQILVFFLFILFSHSYIFLCWPSFFYFCSL